jgi:hypothetical protein
MGYHVRLSALAHMPKADADKALGELVASASRPRNGQGAALDARIRQFELQYELTSDEMRQRLASGDLKETADIASWLFYLKARDHDGAR